MQTDSAESLGTVLNRLHGRREGVPGHTSEERSGTAAQNAAAFRAKKMRTRELLCIYRVHQFLLDYYGLALLLILWEVAPRFGWIDAQFFPPVSLILHEAATLTETGELQKHLLASGLRTAQGLLAAVVLGVPLGFLLGGGFPRLARFLSPLLGLLGQINAFSLFPLFVLFFGIGELAKFSIIFWSCLWPILFTSIAGVQGVEPLFVKLTKSMGGGRCTVITRVLLPAALPSIFTGIRTGATVAFLMLIAAEMIGASSGLGWLVHNSSVNYIIPRLYLAAVLIALLGSGITSLLHRLEDRLIRWKGGVETA